MKLLIILIAFLLYILAPDYYSLPYCLMLEAMFVYVAVFTWKKDSRMDFPGFHLLFSISFFCVTYLYPTLVYSIIPDFSLFSFSQYSEAIITKCTAMATFAYCLYCYGYISQIGKMKGKGNYQTIGLNYAYPSKKIFNWTIIVFVLFIICGGLSFFANQYLEGSSGNVSPVVKYILTFYPCFLVILCVIYRTNLANGLNEKKILLSILAMSSIIMATGSRTIPLLVLTMFGYAYIENKSINKIYVLLLLVIGFGSMVYIGDMRSGGDYLTEESEIGHLSVFTDMIICNRNLYAAYDIVSAEGINFGRTFLSDILSPIPMLQSVICAIFSMPGDFMGSAVYLTYKEFGFGSSLGLGTHIVADVYLCGGFIGLFLFYYLGKFVIMAREKMRNGNILWSVVYIAFIGNAIYCARSGFFGNLRTVIWSLLVFYLLYKTQYLYYKKCVRAKQITA